LIDICLLTLCLSLPPSLLHHSAITITDKADVLFGGTTEPAALACLYSIGCIAAPSNGAITRAVTTALGVPPDRIYINFFDVPRANVGWNGGTFAD
jgi:phenylpyruvate tautomerase